jgi:hypothetical protein
MKITTSLVFLTLLIFTFIFLFSYQQATALENFRIRVWLANVKPYTGQVQLCVDVNTTFASICKKFDAGALKRTRLLLKRYCQSVLKHAFEGKLTVVNAGIFNLTRTQAPLN